MRLLIFILSIVALSCLNAEDFWQPLEISDSCAVRSLACAPDGNVFIGSDKGLYRSSDNGDNWKNVNISGGKCSLPYISSDYTIYCQADVDSAQMVYSVDKGSTWTKLNAPAGIAYYAKDSLIFIAQRFYSNLFKSIDHSYSWQEVFHMPSGGSEFIEAFLPHNDSTFFIGITDFNCSPGNTCGGVYRSIDSGVTWQSSGMKYHYVRAMAKDSTGYIYAGTAGHQYLYSGGIFVNNGQDTVWQQVKNNVYITSLAVTPENVLYAGHRDPTKSFGGVIRSFDGGQNWEDITSGMGENRSVEQLIASPDGYLYALAEYNGQRQLYRSHKSTSIEYTTSTKQLEISGYPNPFNNECRITFQLPSGSENRSFITIFNIKGEVVQRAKLSGNHYTLQAASLAAGVYYAVVNTGNLSKGVRLLYLKSLLS